LLASGDIDTAMTFGREFVEQLKDYYFVGGMPELVLSFSQKKNYSEVQRPKNRYLLDK
jgi:hypothetical protein